MTRFKSFLMFLMLVVIPELVGAREKEPWIVGGAFHTGFLAKHKNSMRALNEHTPHIIELFMAKTTHEEKLWQSFYHYPVYGVSYMMIDLGCPSYLGNAHALYPFMNFNLTGAERIASLNFRVGTGIGYVEKIYNSFDNYRNRSIGTHLNALISLRLEGKVRVIDPLYVSGGLSLTHLSNGSFKKPNTGLNYVTVFTSAGYTFGKAPTIEPFDRTLYEPDRSWRYTIYLSGGIKDHSIYDGAQYPALGLSLDASRLHLACTRYNGAFELFYDASDYYALAENEIYPEKIKTIKIALSTGYGFIFGRFSAIIHLGGYLYAENTNYGRLYQRLLLHYELADRINVRLGLKTHWGQADYIELAFGYRIR